MFRVTGLESSVQRLRFRVKCPGFKVQDSGFRVKDSLFVHCLELWRIVCRVGVRGKDLVFGLFGQGNKSRVYCSGLMV